MRRRRRRCGRQSSRRRPPTRPFGRLRRPSAAAAEQQQEQQQRRRRAQEGASEGGYEACAAGGARERARGRRGAASRAVFKTVRFSAVDPVHASLEFFGNGLKKSCNRLTLCWLACVCACVLFAPSATHWYAWRCLAFRFDFLHNRPYCDPRRERRRAERPPTPPEAPRVGTRPAARRCCRASGRPTRWRRRYSASPAG